MILLAIDPGSTHSAFVVLNNEAELLDVAYLPNAEILSMLSDRAYISYEADHLAIETLHARGMPTSNDELETQLWAGRFIQAFVGSRNDRPFIQVRREQVKGHFGAGGCKNPDGVLRESLIGRFGGAAAVGGVKCKACGGKGWSGRGRPVCAACTGTGWEVPPGPFHGWTGSDRWSALAIACWWFDTCYKGASAI